MFSTFDLCLLLCVIRLAGWLKHCNISLSLLPSDFEAFVPGFHSSVSQVLELVQCSDRKSQILAGSPRASV